MTNNVKMIDTVARMMSAFKSNYRMIECDYVRVEVSGNDMTITSNGKTYNSHINKTGKTRRDTTYMLNEVMNAVYDAYGVDKATAMMEYEMFINQLMGLMA